MITLTDEQVWLAAAIILAAALVAVVISWAILRAGDRPAPSMLVLAVALLAMTALIGGLIFRSDSAIAIASAGLGALAGAVSSTFTNQQPPRREDDPPDDETESE